MCSAQIRLYRSRVAGRGSARRAAASRSRRTPRAATSSGTAAWPSCLRRLRPGLEVDRVVLAVERAAAPPARPPASGLPTCRSARRRRSISRLARSLADARSFPDRRIRGREPRRATRPARAGRRPVTGASRWCAQPALVLDDFDPVMTGHGLERLQVAAADRAQDRVVGEPARSATSWGERTSRTGSVGGMAGRECSSAGSGAPMMIVSGSSATALDYPTKSCCISSSNVIGGNETCLRSVLHGSVADDQPNMTVVS